MSLNFGNFHAALATQNAFSFTLKYALTSKI